MTFEEVKAELQDNMKEVDENNIGLTEFLDKLIYAVDRQIVQRSVVEDGRFECPFCGISLVGPKAVGIVQCPHCGQTVLVERMEK